MIPLNQIYWVAGFLEGEGYFTLINTSAAVRVSQVQKEPLDRLKNLFTGSINLTRKPLNPRHSDIFSWALCGVRAAGLMMTLYPLMSLKRKFQIVRALNVWKLHPPEQTLRKQCPKGHPYSPTNTYIYKDGTRHCKKCTNLRHKNKGRG